MISCAGKLPGNYLSSARTINIVVLLSQKLDIPCHQVTPTFSNGPYRGTWVHGDLAVDLAMYCDETGELQLAVSRAIRALADRPPAAAAPVFPVPPPVESFHVYQQLHAEAEGRALIVAVKEKGMAVKEKAVVLKERGLAVEQQSLEIQKQKLAMHPDLLAATEEDYRAEEKHIEQTCRLLRRELRIRKKDRQDRRLHVSAMVEMKRVLHAINSGTQMCWS